MSHTGYTPLASSIVLSSVWSQSHETVRVWIAMLALMDRSCHVAGTVPGMAHLCYLTPEQFMVCEKILLSPEPENPTKTDDGRRIERIDGGWLVLNGKKWRQKFSDEAKRIRQAKWAMDKRHGALGFDPPDKIGKKPRTKRERDEFARAEQAQRAIDSVRDGNGVGETFEVAKPLNE